MKTEEKDRGENRKKTLLFSTESSKGHKLRKHLERLENYLEFAWTLLKLKYLNGSTPFSMNLDITDECNFRCQICGVWRKVPKYTLDINVFKRQMSKSKILKKVKIFSIGGGEPFTKPLLLKRIVITILKYARPLQIRIVTNGSFTQRIEEFIEFYGRLYKYTRVPLGFKVSIDGVNETHDMIRGVNGAFKMGMETLKMINSKLKTPLYSKMLSVTLGFTDTSKNLNDLTKVFKLAVENNMDFFHKPYIKGGKFYNQGKKNENINDEMDINTDRGHNINKSDNLSLKLNNRDNSSNGSSNGSSDGSSDGSRDRNNNIRNILYTFNKKLIVQLKTINKQRFFEKIPTILFYKAYNRYLQTGRTGVKCYAAKSSFFLIPNGDVTPCLKINYSFGNIYKNDFDAIWKGRINNKIKEFRGKNKGCQCLTPCDTIPFIIVQYFPVFYFSSI